MIKKRTGIILITLSVAVALFFMLERGIFSGLSPGLDSDKPFGLLANVIYLVKENYVEKPNPGKTMEGAFKGLVDSLDSLSSYLNKNSIPRYQQRQDPDLKEPGIVLYKAYGSFPVILGIKENSPAELEGLKLGESVSAIDGRATLTMSMLEANLYLKHKQKQTVNLKLIRAQKNTTINLECKVLYKAPFSFSPADKTSGILKIHTFSPPLVKMLKKNILPGLKGKKKSLILDLRTCWEGTIPEAIKFINLFLQKDNVGYFKGNNKEKEYISCLENAELKKFPLVIWTNPATMGPAEIVTGVLKNHTKAKVIGTRTPGLAAKQDFFLMEDGSGIVLTSAIFQLNKNEEFWQKGIEPDIKIDSTLRDSKNYLKETYKIIPN